MVFEMIASSASGLWCSLLSNHVVAFILHRNSWSVVPVGNEAGRKGKSWKIRMSSLCQSYKVWRNKNSDLHIHFISLSSIDATWQWQLAKRFESPCRIEPSGSSSQWFYSFLRGPLECYCASLKSMRNPQVGSFFFLLVFHWVSYILFSKVGNSIWHFQPWKTSCFLINSGSGVDGISQWLAFICNGL